MNNFASTAAEAALNLPPWLLVVGFALAGLLGLLSRRRAPVRDARRDFSPKQRSEASRRAGGRCEHSVLGFRCRTAGSHADHIIPWSKGGATELSNLQWLCQSHNLRKSNHMPSPFYLHRLVTRRRRYFSATDDPRVEWRIGIAR